MTEETHAVLAALIQHRQTEVRVSIEAVRLHGHLTQTRQELVNEMVDLAVTLSEIRLLRHATSIEERKAAQEAPQ